MESLPSGPAWLVIRKLTNKNRIGEAIGIDVFHKHGEEQWLGADGMHARLDRLLGRSNWTYSIITKAEWETFRDLHGFKDFGAKNDTS